MMNTAKKLFDELNKDYKPNTKRPELGEFMTLKVYNKDNKVEFSIGWDANFLISFNPKTIGVKINVRNRATGDTKSVSKQLPLDQKNLLDTILDFYVKLCK